MAIIFYVLERFLFSKRHTNSRLPAGSFSEYQQVFVRVKTVSLWLPTRPTSAAGTKKAFRVTGRL
jgi:hypothetical protein